MIFRNQQYEELGVPAKKGEPVDDLSSPESIKSHERPPLRKVDQYVRAECPCLSKRATVALLSCMGFIIMFGMRTSMGIVKLQFENKTKVWGEDTASAIESAIFWGYFITQIPGGLIAAAYPANKLFGFAIGTSSLLNFFIPFTYKHPPFIITLKVLQGLVEGVTYPACHGIMRYWAPPLERSKLATLAFSGCYGGVMFAMLICGVLVDYFGPMSPFYFYSVIGMIWYVAWVWLVFEKPALHPCIETKELLYIENSLGKNAETYVAPTLQNTPWLTFFKSMPCYAIFVANFCRSWNFYLLVLNQPIYFSDTYHESIEKNTILGALPHFLMTIIVPSGGILADRIRRKGILTTTQVRKLFNCGGFGMEATFFIVMAYCNDFELAIAALSIGVAFSGFAISGFNVNHLDIAPRYASILMGMSNGIGTIAGCICPYVVNKILGEERTIERWREVFILSAFIHYAGVIFYGIFASGELQEWADPTAEEEKQWNQMAETGNIKSSFANRNNSVNYGSVDKQLPPRPPLPRQLTQESSLQNVPPQQLPPPSAPPVQQQTGMTNPFTGRITNPFRQEAVQPEAQDTYMYGTVNDRTY
ncbi:vesicular glutamate transporter 1 isoform X1 [Coccinella septempunctata]|uniref:vesicular glutamate transporter 1 isoform X1 n=2 Tax=Coccinella septempunctata TaxID=41139 RepID=UPI001D05E05C|nr:vesicular glutamate transporter 1 isoform X1 [Coccinella septempunctata]